MSWCQAREIGKAATVKDVRAVANILEGRRVGLIFYRAADDWYIRRPSCSPWGSVWRVNMERPVMSLTQPSGAMRSKDDPRRWLLSDVHENMRFQGETGWAVKEPLSAGDKLYIGDTILRAAVPILIAEKVTPDEDDWDDVAIADDMLLRGPGLLRSIAVTIGVRLAKRELDEDVTDDDSEEEDETSGDVLEGLEKDLELYR